MFVITSATRCAIAANRQHPAPTIILAQDKSEYDPRQSSQETLSKIKWFNFCDCLTYIQSQLSSLEHKHIVCQLPWAQTQFKSTILQHALDSVQFRRRICSDRGDYPVLWANPFALLVTVKSIRLILESYIHEIMSFVRNFRHRCALQQLTLDYRERKTILSALFMLCALWPTGKGI